MSWPLTLPPSEATRNLRVFRGENWTASKSQAELLNWDTLVFLMAAHCVVWSFLTCGFLACHRSKLLVNIGNFTISLSLGCCFCVHRGSWASSCLGCVQRPGDKYQWAGRFLWRQSSVSVTIFYECVCVYKNKSLWHYLFITFSSRELDSCSVS